MNPITRTKIFKALARIAILIVGITIVAVLSGLFYVLG